MILARCLPLTLCLSLLALPALGQDRPPEKDAAKTTPKKAVPFTGETLLRRLMARYSKLQDYACTVTEMRQIGPMTIRSVKQLKWKSGGKLYNTTERTTPRSGLSAGTPSVSAIPRRPSDGGVDGSPALPPRSKPWRTPSSTSSGSRPWARFR